MYHKGVVAGDFHGPDYSPAGVALICELNREHKADCFFFNGDVADFGQVSKYGPNPFSSENILEEANILLEKVLIPILESLDLEITWHYEQVSPGDPELKNAKVLIVDSCENRRGVKIWWEEGNHEYRLKVHLRNKSIETRGLISMEKVFNLAKLGIQYVHSHSSQGNGVLILTPNLMIMHGNTTGVNQAKNQLNKTMMSTIVNHGHHQGFSRQSSDVSGKDIVCYANGSMCRSQHYSSTSTVNHGFISYWYDDEPPYRFSVFQNNLVCDGEHLPGDPRAYPRTVAEAVKTILLTPWGEYRAVEHAPGKWSVRKTWGEAHAGALEPGKARKRSKA